MDPEGKRPRIVRRDAAGLGDHSTDRGYLDGRLLIAMPVMGDPRFEDVYKRQALGFAAIVLVSSPALEARAEDASPWQRDGHSAVRLLAGSRSGSVLLGGIAFQLQPGWKTYWRTPGDSGVPPRFDFSKSDNVEAVTVLWPAPTKFDDGAGGHSLGYHDGVVLPLRIVAKNLDKPVTLRVDVNYAVCEKICIPVQAEAELPFTSVASTEDSACLLYTSRCV